MTTTSRRQPTEPAVAAAIEAGCRTLRLPTIRDRFGEIATAAEREQLSYLGFLAELVMAECDDRDKRRAARRIHDAGFPRDKRIEEFDFDANKYISPAVIHQLVTCAWVKAGHPLCLIGDSGTGKSHLMIGLGTAAAESGYRVRYTLASKLVNELVEAADDKQLSKTIARYGRVDLLCIDDFVDQEAGVAAEADEFVLQAAGVVRGREPVDPFRRGREQHPVTGLAGPHTQPGGQVRLAGSRRTQENDVLLRGDEVQGAQVRDHVPFQAAGVVKVGLFQRFPGREPGR